jgi:hypothetical protein
VGGKDERETQWERRAGRFGTKGTVVDSFVCGMPRLALVGKDVIVGNLKKV